MRGKAGMIKYSDVIHRITPAYAGKSRLTAQALQAEQDHPRLCGEKFSPSVLRDYSAGSPPPMRGKAARSTPYLGAARITPAYAGKRYLPKNYFRL